MARNQNTFEKRRREMDKKRKAEEKRLRRRQRRDEAGRGGLPSAADATTHGAEPPADAADEPPG